MSLPKGDSSRGLSKLIWHLGDVELCDYAQTRFSDWFNFIDVLITCLLILIKRFALDIL